MWCPFLGGRPARGRELVFRGGHRVPGPVPVSRLGGTFGVSPREGGGGCRDLKGQEIVSVFWTSS